MRLAASIVLALVTAAPAAQSPSPPAPATEAECDRRVVQVLLAFARTAETCKSASRARAVYEQILDHYDLDHAGARAGLGYKRVKGEWQQVTPRDKLPADAATPQQAKTVEREWNVARQRAARLHRELGLLLRAAGEGARADLQFERALAFAPEDVEAHAALGHEEFGGFHGSPEQVAFVRRMQSIFARAKECAAQTVEVQEIPAASLPRELAGPGPAFAGARSRHLQHWVVGTPDEAANSVRWGERGLALLQHLFAGDAAGRSLLLPRRIVWLAIVRTNDQRDRLLAGNDKLLGDLRADQVGLVGGTTFEIPGGLAEWSIYRDQDADRAVGHVTNRCGGGWLNRALCEGLVHVMTWLLCGTLEASYMKIPATAGAQESSRRNPAVWLRELRAAIDAGQDWPLVQVPRERMESFRNPVRQKAWSFMLWLLARHPDRWVQLLRELEAPNLMPEDVAATFERVLGRRIGEVEEEWRQWARAGSPIGKASGLPQ